MILENGQRAGFFIGDAAGMGKGRQVIVTAVLFFNHSLFTFFISIVTPGWACPMQLRSCRNKPAVFPGRMSYKATKSGLVCALYLSML